MSIAPIRERAAMTPILKEGNYIFWTTDDCRPSVSGRFSRQPGDFQGR
jgi:hypothetical protein